MCPITDDISGPGPGEYTAGAANVPGTPTYVGNATSQISFTFSANSNGSLVQYAIYATEEGVNLGFVTPGTGAIRAEANDASDIPADWQTYALWTALVTATGLTAPRAYKFKVKARNEAGTETAYSALSATMVPFIDVDRGPTSVAETYELTTGNTKVSGLSVTGVAKTVTAAFTLTNKLATASRVAVEYSKNNSDWFAATVVFGDATSQFDVTNPSGTTFRYTYDGTGTAPLFVTYGLATGNSIVVSASTNFAAGNKGTFALTAVAETYFEVTNAAGVVESNKTLVVSNGLKASGGILTGLTTSEAGTAHSLLWSTCSDLGNSYHATTYFRLTPYDASPSGGDANTVASTTVAVDNRPLITTIAEIDVNVAGHEKTDVTWDKDTTPILIFNMADYQCGNYLYFIVTIKNSAGAEVQSISSAEDIAGWSYEQDHAGAPGVWTDVTSWGVPVAYAPPNVTGNLVRYIVQTALAAGDTYSVYVTQAEIVHVL